MAFKRKFKSTKTARGVVRKPFIKKGSRKLSNVAALTKRVNKLTRTIETKSGSEQITDSTEYQHNSMYVISNSFLKTQFGAGDIENSKGQRIGDKITLSGVSFKMMLKLELYERYSDVTFRMMVVRSAKGDATTGETLW